MLSHTFLHIPGIGEKTENRLWAGGIHCWQDFLQKGPIHPLQHRWQMATDAILESKRQLRNANPAYFSRLLPTGFHWRLFPDFRGSAVCLDIETSGLESWQNEITTIALYDGHAIRYYINGHNLDAFIDDLQRYQIIITYNGKCFDIPFIQNHFGVRLDQVHIDLRYVLKSLGYAGGLKVCEVRLGIDRGPLKGIDGFFAVLLWQEFRRSGNRKALETLLAYNIQDVLSLENLMVAAYNLNVRKTPFHDRILPEPVPPPNPFDADLQTIAKIRNTYRHIIGN